MTFKASLAFPIAIATVAAASVCAAATPCPTVLPPSVACGTPDPAAAPAGTYAIDANHASIVARVSHIGYSFSTFRFGKVTANVVWSPASPEQSKLTAAVDTASIGTPVEGFATELQGEKYLNSAKFPQATFVSTAFHKVDATHGKVDGQFTLLGVTKPVTFDVTLVGAGKGFGAPRMGVEAVTTIDPQAYGMSPFFVAPIELVIDAEFQKTP